MMAPGGRLDQVFFGGKEGRRGEIQERNGKIRKTWIGLKSVGERGRIGCAIFLGWTAWMCK